MSQLLGTPVGLWARIKESLDWVVLTLAFSITTLAVVNLDSAGIGDWTGKVEVQLRWVGIGSVAMLVFAALDYRIIYRSAYVAYFGGLMLLALVPFFGIRVNNATRWLGVGEFRIQPSELFKVVVIAALARYLHDLPPKQQKGLRHLVVAFAMVLVPVAFVVRQPDLSTGVITLLIALSILSVTELTLRSMLAVSSVGVLSFVGGWRFLGEYQRKRIDVWLNPELYADNEGYQTIQGMISVGNGGFFGQGVRNGTQNVLHFLPERFTDFPFAVYAEEWGFVGCTMLLTLYFSLVLWSVNLASQARDRFGALLCTGVSAMLFWHIVINVGMVLQLVPVAGIGMPFFSFGGSNVLTTMIGVGFLISVSRARHVRR